MANDTISNIEWDGYRVMVAAKLRGAFSHPHILRCAKVLDHLDYEGPELFSVSSCAPHTAYEEMIEAADCYSLSDWWADMGREVTRDWVIDMHPGLCPDDVVNLLDANPRW